MKFNELLLELNLYNRQPLIDNINQLLDHKRVTKPEIKNWFLKQYVNWFLSSTDDSKKLYWVHIQGDDITPHTYKEGEPEWAKKQGMYDFTRFPYFDEENLKHIIDYFEQLDDVELKKIYKQPYEIITRKVAEWDEFLKNQKALKGSKLAENVDYKTILPFQDGYKFIQLISKHSYDVEGNQMGHCAAGYADRKSSTLYSLKDPKGMSHVTIEVRDQNDPNGGIVQIKGKENAAPVKKYIPYVKAFIEKTRYPVLEDGGNIGMLDYSGQYYFKDSNQWRKIYNDIIIPRQYDIIDKVLKEARVNNGKVQEINLYKLHLEKLPDFSNIRVTNNCFFHGNQLTSLQGAPKEVEGDFYCSQNQLTSLQGAPQTVGGDFYCSGNQLTSLQGAPKEVEGDFYCAINQLTSLQGAPKEVGGNFYCADNQLTSLQDAPQTVGGYFSCNDNQLTSLQGAPQTVGGDFVCGNNQLISLQGVPQTVRGNFVCSYNQLISLQGAPKEVGRSFYCGGNPVQFTDNDVKAVTPNIGGLIFSVQI